MALRRRGETEAELLEKEEPLKEENTEEEKGEKGPKVRKVGGPGTPVPPKKTETKKKSLSEILPGSVEIETKGDGSCCFQALAKGLRHVGIADGNP